MLYLCICRGSTPIESPFAQTQIQMVFMGRGFTSRGQEPRSVFNAAVGKIQANKHYVESLPLVLKDK